MLLNNPDGRLSLKEARRVGQTYELHFLVTKDPVLDKNHAYSLFSHRFLNAEGKEHWANQSSTFAMNEGTEDEIIYDIPVNDLSSGPLTLFIDDYPRCIQGSFRLRVK